MSIFCNGKRINQYRYKSEEEFEKDIATFSKTIFGKSTIYIDAKKKIVSKTLGGTIPDGFFFDLSDIENPEFYLVEVELSSHSFFNHIFPQITKFFAFFKNTKKQKDLIGKLFSIINVDSILKNEFKKFLGEQEIFKFLSDTLENSQNILLLIDGEKEELPEIIDTYTDTWGRMVKPLVVKKYVGATETIFTLTPDYETIAYISPEGLHAGDDEQLPQITEEFHLDGVEDNVRQIYEKIKTCTFKVNKDAIFNPQKYYISIRTSKNVAFLKIRKKKLRIIVMMAEGDVEKMVKHYPIKSLSDSVQNFYNGPCAAIDVGAPTHFDEIESVLRELLI